MPPPVSQAATGFSTPAATSTASSVFTVTSYPIVANAAPPTLGSTGVFTTTAAATASPPATLTPVDLMSVYCVSRSLCFAAGGFLPASANTVATAYSACIFAFYFIITLSWH